MVVSLMNQSQFIQSNGCPPSYLWLDPWPGLSEAEGLGHHQRTPACVLAGVTYHE
uniref:Uncharacterized protein n=1 Tax=Anguilla anguilla TaxID=7936 RepID=A0A0E9QRV7_ANGAN